MSGVIASAPTRPRPIFCVTGHAYRSLEVAEAVAAGRFTHAQVTLDLGLPPDWLGADLPPDEEWRIEWNKFYYGLDLAHAFSTTGRRRFLDAWELLVTSWIDQCDVGLDTTDVAARRIQNWIYAWERFASAPAFDGLSGGTEHRLLESLGDQVTYVRDGLTPGPERNHRTLELYALLIGALAFPGSLDPDGSLVELAIGELHRSLTEGTRPDGVHRESSTHYHLLVLRSFLGARENARRFRIRVPDGYDDRLARACEFAMHCHRPDGPVSALSDADSVEYSELLALAASVLERPDLRWVASRGRRGSPPAVRGAGFPAAGYFTQRSGWGAGATRYADERYLIFDCGPLGDGGHGHYDLLSVEIAAAGRPLVVDPGRYTYSEQDPNLRHWFKGTAAHNTVCVDGLDQTPYRRGRPRGPVASGRFLGRETGPGIDLLRASAVSPAYDAEHIREVAFVADEYWLIADRMRSASSHRYDLRFHLASEAQGAVRIDSLADGTVVRAPGLALVLDPALEVTLEPGWVAPLYGLKHEAPVVSAAIEGSGEVTFMSLIAAHDASLPAPRMRVRPGLGEDGVAVEVSGVGAGGGAVDVVAWGRRGAGLLRSPERRR